VPDLAFRIESAASVPFAAVPMVAFSLEITNHDPSVVVHSAVLRCQIQIDPARRRYDPSEQARLHDLFGEPERWGSTVKPMLWTHVSMAVPQFAARTVASLMVPCSFDFNLAATKYFDGLREGDVPLTFLFSGTAFYEDARDQTLRVTPIPWDKEARFRLPVEVWRSLMDHYHPNGAWLRVGKDTFDRIAEFKRREGIPTWDGALERLLGSSREVVRW
jgi:hypothetical protein